MLRAFASLLLPLVLASCPAPDAPEYRLIFEKLDAGLLSVWGTSARDVWTVGGDVDELGPLVLHYDGHEWSRMPTDAHGDLWWVHGFAEGPVFFGGEGGLILRYEDGVFSRLETPSDQPTVFGIWGSSPSDVFAVGGVGRAAGFVWHWDGAHFDEIALPSTFGGQSLFKVWGTGRDDAWIVGTDGAVLHWNGTNLEAVDAGTERTLFTVHAVDETVAAVGGLGSGVLIERDAEGRWQDVAPDLLPQLFGVYLTSSAGAAVGINGTFVLRERGRWEIEETGLDLAETLHSVWIDPDGGIWAAGGQVLAAPLVRGVLVYRGREHIAANSDALTSHP
jgi:hypothetical protein